MIRFFFSFIICVLIGINSLADNEASFIKAIDGKNWHQARKLNPNYSTLISWLELTYDDNPNFYQLKKFINEHPHWPKINNLYRKIEESNFKDAKNSDIISWFKTHPPKTIPGKKKYINLIEDNNIKIQYTKEIWHIAEFSKIDQENFIKLYSKFLTQEDHLSRINNMLFKGKIDQASRVLHYIDNKFINVFKDRIAILQGKKNVIEKYKNFSADIGILYDIANIYNKQQDDTNLLAILKNSSKIKSPYQGYFWNMKSKLIRDLLVAQDYNTAYLFSSTHGTTSNGDYSEAEWLAGWIALRFLNDAKTALTHFQNMHKAVKKPISVSRGCYWIARSYEKLNNKTKSEYWYNQAAKYFTTFYGQLSACKINQCKVQILDDPEPSNEDTKHYKNNILVNAALILNKSKKYNHLTQSFLYQAIDNSKSIGEVALITKLGFKLNQNHLSVEAAKHATYRDIYIIHHNYPILDSIYKEHNSDCALVMSLIRQESVFNHKAISCAGAMGLMQIMPHVAKEEAKKLNIKFSKNKLLSDTHFNTQLGTNHLDHLVNCYEPSYILSIAAYNAGEKAVKQWIENNGDPRLMNDVEEIIDWMEKISYYETRNYVQRVLEGKSVYHLLINKTSDIPLVKDLIEGSGKNCTLRN